MNGILVHSVELWEQESVSPCFWLTEHFDLFHPTISFLAIWIPEILTLCQELRSFIHPWILENILPHTYLSYENQDSLDVSSKSIFLVSKKFHTDWKLYSKCLLKSKHNWFNTKRKTLLLSTHIFVAQYWTNWTHCFSMNTEYLNF